MGKQVEYHIPMKRESDAIWAERWPLIHSYSINYLPFNNGNPDGWVFSREKVKGLGDCVVLKTIDYCAANAFADFLKEKAPQLKTKPPYITLEEIT